MEFDDTLMSRVEDAGLNASAPPQQRWLDGWLLRTLPGKARRARCIHALAPGRLLAEKLRLAADIYRDAGLPMIFRLHRFTQPPGLDRELEALGWALVDHTTVMIRPSLRGLSPTVVAMTAATSTDPPPPDGLLLEGLDGGAFAEAVGALRGSEPGHRKAHALRLAHSPVPYSGFALRRRDDAQVLACAQFAREGTMVGLYDVFTHESARGHGLASWLCERLLALAAAQGAKCAYLQVDSQNQPALTVYRRLGFAAAYSYHYREAPAA